METKSSDVIANADRVSSSMEDCRGPLDMGPQDQVTLARMGKQQVLKVSGFQLSHLIVKLRD